MQTVIEKWGNSAVVRLPATLLAHGWLYISNTDVQHRTLL